MILLDRYNEAKQQLLGAFKYPYDKDLYDLKDYTDVYWDRFGDSLVYFEEGARSEDDAYGFEVNPRSAEYIFGGLTMLLVNDDNGGEDFLAIFENTKKAKDTDGKLG